MYDFILTYLLYSKIKKDYLNSQVFLFDSIFNNAFIDFKVFITQLFFKLLFSLIFEQNNFLWEHSPWYGFW